MNGHPRSMIGHLLPWLALLLLTACQPMDMNNLRESQGRYLLRASKTPYTGDVVVYFDADQERVYQSGKLVDGLKEGVWTINHWNGESQEITFVHGVRHGTSKYYYTGGRLKSSQEYQDGLPHGASYQWSTDGRMVRHAQYNGGKIDLLSESHQLVPPQQDSANPITLIVDLLAPNG